MFNVFTNSQDRSIISNGARVNNQSIETKRRNLRFAQRHHRKVDRIGVAGHELFADSRCVSEEGVGRRLAVADRNPLAAIELNNRVLNRSDANEVSVDSSFGVCLSLSILDGAVVRVSFSDRS